jgi:hypothetical protein
VVSIVLSKNSYKTIQFKYITYWRQRATHWWRHKKWRELQNFIQLLKGRTRTRYCWRCDGWVFGIYDTNISCKLLKKWSTSAANRI